MGLGIDNAIPNISAVTVVAGSTLDLNNFNDTIGSLAGAGNVILGTGTLITLATGGDNSDTTFSGIISGSGGFTHEGGRHFTGFRTPTHTGGTTLHPRQTPLKKPRSLRPAWFGM